MGTAPLLKLYELLGAQPPFEFHVFGNILFNFVTLLMIFKLILIFGSYDCKNQLQILFWAPLLKS